jgi:hypothetical protein
MKGIRREIKLKIAERRFHGVLKDLSSFTYSKIYNRVGLLPYITNYNWLVVLLLTASLESTGRTGAKTAHTPIELLQSQHFCASCSFYEEVAGACKLYCRTDYCC